MHRLNAVLALVAIILGMNLMLSTRSGATELREFNVGLDYQAFGVGPQPMHSGFIPVIDGSEGEVAAWAIVIGLGTLGNIVENVSLADVIEQGRDWTTSISLIEPAVVEAYNAAQDDQVLRLPQNRRYGIQYAGQYLLVNEQLRFKISSTLYQKGSQTDFMQYESHSYDDGYFFNRAKQAIESALQQLTKQPNP
jgi:hypothetical protein